MSSMAGIGMAAKGKGTPPKRQRERRFGRKQAPHETPRETPLNIQNLDDDDDLIVMMYYHIQEMRWFRLNKTSFGDKQFALLSQTGRESDIRIALDKPVIRKRVPSLAKTIMPSLARQLILRIETVCHKAILRIETVCHKAILRIETVCHLAKPVAVTGESVCL